VVAVSAIPDPGATFLGFYGALNGGATPQSLVMTGPKTITGSFNTAPNVAVTTVPPGQTVTVDGGYSVLA